MRLALDLQAAQSRTFGERGIARWSRAYATALVRAGAPVDVVLLSPSSPRPTLPAELDRADLVRWNTAGESRRWGGDDVAYHVLSPFERGRPVDATVVPHALDAAGALVVTLYDAIPFALAGWYLADPATRRFMEGRRSLLQRADLLLAISDHARMDAIELLGLDPDRVVTIGSGADGWWTPPGGAPGDADNSNSTSSSEASGDSRREASHTSGGDDRAAVRAALPEVGERFVFTVAGWLPHKNPLGLIDAWGRVPASTRAARQLVITCAVPAEAHGLVAARVAAAGLQPHEVALTGRVDDTVLRALYRTTELFVFASLYEGFGLPVLEAVRCGALAVTSNVTSIPEVLDHPDSTFDPTDPDDMARVINRGLLHDDVRGQLAGAARRAVATHTWERVAQRAMVAYAQLDERPRRRRARPSATTPLRVALNGPLPPAPSGVATYTARIASPLGDRLALDCYAELAPWHGSPRAYRHLPIDALGHSLSPWSYDAMVHVIGNSDQHLATVRLALRYPGVLWLHETELSALAGLLGHEAPALLGDLVRSSRAVIVHTEAAARAVRAAAGDAGTTVEIVPLPVPNLTELGLGHAALPRTMAVPAGDAAKGGENAPAVVVCFGVVGQAKQPDVVLEAVATVARHRQVRLVFVGPATDDQRAALERRATMVGMAGAFTLTGHVTARDYAAWLAKATVAVQLRAGVGGEASGTVADAIGAGLPLITSVASAGELPDGVAIVLPPGSEAATVAEALERLLSDPAARVAMIAAQHAHAQRWGTAQVAERLADLLSRPQWQGVGGAGAG